MRLAINLAREPMRRDRAILVASTTVGILLLITLIALTALEMTDRRNMNDSRVVIAQVQRQLAKVNGEQAEIDAQLRLPQNASLLYRSDFYNQLIHRKSVSWTKIFSDLETVLPYNVRILSIRPQLTARNELSLDMVVASQTPEPIFTFMEKLEGSEIFGDITQTSQVPPTQNDPYFRFHLVVPYDQKL
jgi:Tfp pilus assembly protein PilN